MYETSETRLAEGPACACLNARAVGPCSLTIDDCPIASEQGAETPVDSFIPERLLIAVPDKDNLDKTNLSPEYTMPPKTTNKQQKSFAWWIRITAPWEHIENKLKTLRGWIDVEHDFVGYHHGDKSGAPHAHIALQMRKELQQQSLALRLKEVFGVSGPAFSCVPWDGKRTVYSYCYHDVNGKVDYTVKITDDELKEIKQINTLTREIVENANSKSKSRMVDYVLDQISKTPGERWSSEHVVRFMFQLIRTNQFHNPGSALFERYYDEIMLRKGTDVEQDEMQEIYVQQFLAKKNNRFY